MTVQELIDKLNLIEDKSMSVFRWGGYEEGFREVETVSVDTLYDNAGQATCILDA